MFGLSDWLLDGMILFGGFLALLLSVGEFPNDRKNTFQIFFASTLVSIGCMQLSGALVLNQNAGQEATLRFWNLPLLYLPPAFAFLTVLSLSEDDFRWKPIHLLLLFPFFLSLGAVLYLRISGEYLSPPWEGRIDSNQGVSALLFLYIGAGLFSLGFVFPIFRALIQVQEPKAKFLFGIFLADSAFVGILGILGLVYDSIFLKLALLVVTLAVCLVYYVRRRYFDFPEIVRSDIVQAKYARSRLTGLETESILERLNVLLEKDKIHRRENLSLAELAEELSLTSHQLSELINRRLGKGYFSLINQYRIEDAKSLLLETDKTVLEIAMTVGFNNRSSFNEAFLKQTQKTPISFRKMYKLL